MKQFIILYPESTAILNQFADLEKKDNVSLHYIKKKKIKNFFLKCIRKIHLSKRINEKISLPFKNIWFDGSNIKIKKNSEVYLLFVSGVLSFYDYGSLKKYISNPRFKLILLLFNSLDAASPTLLNVKEKINTIPWDATFTFDKKDALNYNYQYLGMSYYSKPTNITKYPNDSDTYFVGGLKGNREKTILSVFEKLFNDGLKCDFNLFYSEEQENIKKEYADVINYYTGGWKPYSEVVSHLLSTNCIIEILQQEQNSQSIRYFEAVCFNKKLLTNNPDIVSLPFYNPKYMKIFTNIEDIDTDWISKKEEIDYGYNNEFSPIHLVDKIENFFAK